MANGEVVIAPLAGAGESAAVRDDGSRQEKSQAGTVANSGKDIVFGGNLRRCSRRHAGDAVFSS